MQTLFTIGYQQAKPDAVLGELKRAKIDLLYQIPEGVTRRGFPNRRGSDSRWRTKEVRHVGSDTIAAEFYSVSPPRFGEEDQRWSTGPSASDPCHDLRRCDPHRGSEDRRRRSADHPGLGVTVQRSGHRR